MIETIKMVTVAGMESQQPSQIRENTGLMSLIMGRTGSGKTSLLETLFPSEYLPLAILDYDLKSHVLRDHPNEIEIFKKPNWKQTDDFVQFLESKGKHSPFKTVCFDGVTLLQTETQRAAGVYLTSNPGDRLSRYGDANYNMIHLAERCVILAERGTHIIFNMWASAEKEDEQDAYKKVLPDITPALQNKLVGQFVFVAYLEKSAPPKTFPPTMRTGGSERYGTNMALSPDSPLRSIPDKITNPSWKVIFDSFHGKPWSVT